MHPLLFGRIPLYLVMWVCAAAVSISVGSYAAARHEFSPGRSAVAVGLAAVSILLGSKLLYLVETRWFPLDDYVADEMRGHRFVAYVIVSESPGLDGFQEDQRRYLQCHGDWMLSTSVHKLGNVFNRFVIPAIFKRESTSGVLDARLMTAGMTNETTAAIRSHITAHTY